MCIYGPSTGHEGSWEDIAPKESMLAMLGQCEPR